MKIYNYVVRSASLNKVIIFSISSAILATLLITAFFGLIEVKPEATMDSQMFYTSQTFYDNLKEQGEVGRRSYLILHAIDYLFITQFYLLMSFTIVLLLRKLTKNKKVFILFLIPLGAGLFDILENLAIDLSLIFYPQKVLLLGQFSGYFTFFKFIFIYIAFGLILLFLAMNIFLFIRKKVK